MTKEELYNNLIIFAINTHAQNGYRNQSQAGNDLLTNFCKLPLKELAPFWTDCADQAKLMIVKSHEEEFLAWVNSNE
jgi:hypothetical protein